MKYVKIKFFLSENKKAALEEQLSCFIGFIVILYLLKVG